MAASPRIKAQNITFSIDGVDYACDATSVSLELGDAPGDVRTFCESSVGKQWALSLEGITSQASTSLYQVLMDNFGTEAAFVVSPHGGSAGTETPNYTGTVVFTDMPPVTMNAGEIATFAVTLEVDNSTHDPSTKNFWGLTKVTA